MTKDNFLFKVIKNGSNPSKNKRRYKLYVHSSLSTKQFKTKDFDKFGKYFFQVPKIDSLFKYFKVKNSDYFGKYVNYETKFLTEGETKLFVKDLESISKILVFI